MLQPDDTILYKVLTLGPTDGPLRVVKTGLKAGDKVAVTNLNMLQNKMKVTPKLVPAPGTKGTSETTVTPPPTVAPPTKP